jgi:hypothetical protein
VAAQQHGLTLIKECCVMEEHRHLSQRSGHPEKWGVHVRCRKPACEDNRKRLDDSGYTAGGGGGHVACGGARSVVDGIGPGRNGNVEVGDGQSMTLLSPPPVGHALRCNDHVRRVLPAVDVDPAEAIAEDVHSLPSHGVGAVAALVPLSFPCCSDARVPPQ